MKAHDDVVDRKKEGKLTINNAEGSKVLCLLAYPAFANETRVVTLARSPTCL
jgi:hypothetical protein